MINGTLRPGLEQFMKGKKSSLTLDASIQECLAGIMEGFMESGSFNAIVSYFVSNRDKMYQVSDEISPNGTPGILDIEHNPGSADGRYAKTYFRAAPGEYSNRLLHPDNITFIEVFLAYGDIKFAHRICINVEQTPESPMEKIDLGGPSYITLARYRKSLNVSFEPSGF